MLFRSDVADYEAHPALESALDGIECFIDGQPATKIISLSYIVFKDDTQAKMELGRSTVKNISSSDGVRWNMKDEYYLNRAMIKDDPKETGDVINASKLGHANNIASVKVGTKTYMALSDANGKIWVASTTDGKDWTIVKEELSLTGSVSSIDRKSTRLNSSHSV